MTSTIELLLEESRPASVEILQLYEHLELLREGDPARNTLFILGRTALAETPIGGDAPDQLILVNPPPDATTRFRLGDQTAAIFTSGREDEDSAQRPGLPLVQTIPGGVAHVRLDNHFVDIYAQPHHTIVHLPALGVLYGGDFGSDVTVPPLAAQSDGAHSGGADELETLRLLASIVKQGKLQLYISTVGNLAEGIVATMERLAADVAYLHTLRRVVPGMVQRGDSEAQLLAMADTLLPASRRTELSQQTHQANLRALFQTLSG